MRLFQRSVSFKIEREQLRSSPIGRGVPSGLERFMQELTKAKRQLLTAVSRQQEVIRKRALHPNAEQTRWVHNRDNKTTEHWRPIRFL